MNRAVVVLLLLIANAIVGSSKEAARHRRSAPAIPAAEEQTALGQTFLLSAAAGSRVLNCREGKLADGACPL